MNLIISNKLRIWIAQSPPESHTLITPPSHTLIGQSLITSQHLPEALPSLLSHRQFTTSRHCAIFMSISVNSDEIRGCEVWIYFLFSVSLVVRWDRLSGI